MSNDKNKIKNIIEALLFVAGKPVEYKVLKNVLETSMRDIRNAIELLNKEYEEKNSALVISEVAEGFQLITRAEYSFWLKKMFGNKKLLRLPPTSLETLAIIAYKQPITKAEIEAIRGVNSDGVVKNLIDKKMICITGRKEIIGRPLIYGTTKDFLEYFGLRTLEDLPDTEELEALFEQQELENMNNENIKKDANADNANADNANADNANADNANTDTNADLDSGSDTADTSNDEKNLK